MLKMPTVEKTNGTSNKYCEDWLPVKNITNGMIQLENGYFVCGIKVEPKNIFILDEGARNNVIVQLRNFYNTIDFEYMEKYIRVIKKLIIKNTVEHKDKMIDDNK